VSSDFYTISILPYATIIIKICRAYTNTQQDFEDYYQEVCLQIWKSHLHSERFLLIPFTGSRTILHHYYKTLLSKPHTSIDDILGYFYIIFII